MSNEGNVLESLIKLVEFVETGHQNFIVMTGKGSKLRTVFNPPLQYNMTSVGYKMCLIRLETYSSFPNIAESNNAVKIFISGKWYDIHIPTRINQYSIAEITFETGWRKEKKTTHNIECKQEYIGLCS